MNAWFSDAHRLHSGLKEFSYGEWLDGFELPVRAEAVRQRFEALGLGAQRGLALGLDAGDALTLGLGRTTRLGLLPLALHAVQFTNRHNHGIVARRHENSLRARSPAAHSRVSRTELLTHKHAEGFGTC